MKLKLNEMEMKQKNPIKEALRISTIKNMCMNQQEYVGAIDIESRKDEEVKLAIENLKKMC